MRLVPPQSKFDSSMERALRDLFLVVRNMPLRRVRCSVQPNLRAARRPEEVDVFLSSYGVPPPVCVSSLSAEKFSHIRPGGPAQPAALLAVWAPA